MQTLTKKLTSGLSSLLTRREQSPSDDLSGNKPAVEVIATLPILDSLARHIHDTAFHADKLQQIKSPHTWRNSFSV